MFLKDRVVIITGAARGIGKVCAERVARQGGSVAIADVLDGTSTVEAIREARGEAACIPTDVADEASANDLARKTLERYGHIDGLVYNAALFAGMEYHPFEQITVEERERVMPSTTRGLTPRLAPTGE